MMVVNYGLFVQSHEIHEMIIKQYFSFAMKRNIQNDIKIELLSQTYTFKSLNFYITIHKIYFMKTTFQDPQITKFV